MSDEPTASPTVAAAAKVAAIRAYVYPEPAVERRRAAGHCACHHGPSLWDLYVINQMTSRSAPTSCGNSSSDNNSKGGRSHWVEVVIGALFLVCAVAASIYDASKTLVLRAMVGEADALILPLGGNASVLFDRWKRNELAFWWVHSLSICLTAPLLLAILVARVHLDAPESTYWLLALPALSLGSALAAYHLLGYRSANRAVLDKVAARLVAGDDADRKTR
ncbi:hypothetical protein pqer_cds_37 [Pandoravirus quercus]|uniref:Uncharacterized protein n=1 Tax=Pandoravirus quercus TaxID=2107709 RepID=A0A2U7U7R1_9VIRU|nr:hypothetical protein pqer_cds_37 [Pandoravirus quercus]AVK74459.1 hypothetical protein pqer_cds_37 [Pandoravirus quercus]